MQILEVILEIIKVTVPALIVFFTVQMLFKRYLNYQLNQQQLSQKKENQNVTMPMRLQAYERLSLFCERISIPALLLRLEKQEMNCATLQYSLLMSIQAEYEHNITQQIYVSNELWQIIQTAKEDVIEMITLAHKNKGADAPAKEMSQLLMSMLAERQITPIDHAKLAIKKEASTHF